MPPQDKQTDSETSAFASYADALKTLREDNGKTQEDVANACLISHKMIGHYENKRRIPGLEVSKAFDGYFKIPKPGIFTVLQPLVIEELNLPTGMQAYFEQETQAASIRIVAPNLYPGLIQTEDCARVILTAGQRAGTVEGDLSLRMSRQEILERPDPPELVVLLKEAVLREIIGTAEITKNQLGHLLDLMGLPNINIQVIPTGAPVYLAGELTLLDFDEGPGLAHSEGGGGGILVEAPDQVAGAAIRFSRIAALAMSAADSKRLIREIMESL